MVLKAIGRILLVPFAALMAALASSFVIFTLGSERITHAVYGSQGIEAADQMKPEELAGYANSLAEKFHEYYEKVDVIHSDEQVKNARAVLVHAVRTALRNSMLLLGIHVSERM